MSRDDAIGRGTDTFDSGAFRAVLARRVAMPTESQNPDRAAVRDAYLADEIGPALEAMGFTCRTLSQGGWPFLVAERIEDDALPTVWVPHSYPGCSQHAPDEHVPLAVVREGLAIMAGLYWDLGEPGTP